MDGCGGCDKISVYHSSRGQPPSAPEQMKSDVENQRHVTLLQQLWQMLINAHDTSNREETNRQWVVRTN